MSFNNRIVHGYSEIKITSDEYAVILKQYGYVARESVKPTNSLPEKDEEYQDHLREVESGRECGHDHPSFNSPEEREFYDEKLQALKEEGGRTDDEIESLALSALEEGRKYDDLPF